MTDFLLELRSEEIPARMQARAREDLARLFAEEIAKSGLTAAGIDTFATPRRLALIVRGLTDETAAQSEERKGPRTGAPEAALAGFLRSTGLTRDQLTERDGIWFAQIEKPGRATAYVLADAIPAIIRAFPWPKSMRWGSASASTESLRWVRPLQGIVALLGETIVPLEIDGIQSGATTLGHRFHQGGSLADPTNQRRGPITIGSAADYAQKLRACHVIIDQDERAALIRDGARAAAQSAGLTLVEDEGLVAENAGLTEWPVPLLGRFDPGFLDVPPEVIQLTMRTNQKYFSCTDGGQLANAFICTANVDAADGGAGIVAGNQRVLTARLADAKFFWEADLKIPLEEQAKKLGSIVFHEKLGTIADKADRVAKLARWLVTQGIIQSSPPGGGGGEADGGGLNATKSPSVALRAPPPPEGEDLANLAETAARLCKADLVTGLVGEFPELQGIVGGHLARAQGLDPRIAEAIRDHYKPVGQGDEVPTAPVTVAVSLADKLDTLGLFFGMRLAPTGSKDPFALRRAALGLLRILQISGIRLRLMPVAAEIIKRSAGDAARSQHGGGTYSVGFGLEQRTGFSGSFPSQAYDLLAFLADRLKVQQREAGVRHDLIDAVFALGGEDDLVRLLARVKALQAFVATADGANLLSGYKRAANILKKENYEPTAKKPLSYLPEPAEAGLILALDAAEPRAATAVAREDFEGAMAALAGLRVAVDAFFETVTVNDPDAVKRAARLALLARIRDAVHSVADFSRIEG